jgi:hypothetical protein
LTRGRRKTTKNKKPKKRNQSLSEVSPTKVQIDNIVFVEHMTWCIWGRGITTGQGRGLLEKKKKKKQALKHCSQPTAKETNRKTRNRSIEKLTVPNNKGAERGLQNREVVHVEGKRKKPIYSAQAANP